MFPIIATIIEIFNHGYDFSLKINHHIVSINPAFTEMLGHRQEDIVGEELDPLVANPEHLQEQVLTKVPRKNQFSASSRQSPKVIVKPSCLLNCSYLSAQQPPIKAAFCRIVSRWQMMKPCTQINSRKKKSIKKIKPPEIRRLSLLVCICFLGSTCFLGNRFLRRC
jgi:hypothetical protein